MKIIISKTRKIFSLSLLILFTLNLSGFAFVFCSESNSQSCCRQKCNMDAFKMESLKFTKNCNCGVKKSIDFKVEANIENFVLPSNLNSHIIISDAYDLSFLDTTKGDSISDILIQKLAPDRCIVNCVFRI